MDITLKNGVSVTIRDANMHSYEDVIALLDDLTFANMDRGIGFLLAALGAYEAMVEDTLAKMGLTAACSKGCGACCNQVFTCFPIEADFIMDYLKSISLSYQDRKTIKRRIAPIRAFAEKLRSTQSIFNEGAMFRQYYSGMHDYACPFLGADNVCIIYPARPILCRNLRMEEMCDVENMKSSRARIRLFVDSAISDAIRESEQEMGHDTTDTLMIAHLIARGILDIL